MERKKTPISDRSSNPRIILPHSVSLSPHTQFKKLFQMCYLVYVKTAEIFCWNFQPVLSKILSH